MFYEKSLGCVSFFVFAELERIPGFVHAFTSRRTDAALKDAGQPAEVARQKQLFLGSLGLDRSQIVQLQQTHSDQVIALELAEGRKGDGVPADGLMVMSPGRFAVIRTADCLPILAIAPRQRTVCALHAGWRGTRDRITAQGIRRMLELGGVRPEELKIALGPCIRRCCYEVGDEVRRQFAASGHDVERVFAGRYLDLIEANLEQIQELGIREVFDSGLCTRCRGDLFYSYRREGKTGRMWALAGFQALD